MSSEAELSSFSASELSRVYDVYSRRRRRFLVSYLAEADRQVSREELADALAAHDVTDPAGTAGGVDRDAAAVSIHHVHLPKLEAAGVVRTSSRGVSLTPYGKRTLSSIRDEFDVRSHDGTCEE